MALRIGSRIGVYEVRPLEGRGANADVYRAVDTALHREVALKVVVDGHDARPFTRLSRKRLEREAQILAALEHPNIARVLGFEHGDGVDAIVMELVDGPTLADRLAAGTISVGDALAIADQIAAALEAAHERGIVHRDLKPSNVKVSDDGTVKVLDFGLARILPRAAPAVDHQASTITLEGMPVGTAAYMSPEQARGHDVDPRADIWAFGCVVYEMLTGTRAFAGDDTASTLAAVLTFEPDWTRIPAGMPRTAVSFVKRCLRKDRNERPRHIGDVRLALSGAFEDGATAAAAARGRRSWPVLPAVMLGAVVASAPALLWWRGPASEPRSYIIHAPAQTAFDHLTMEPFPALSPDGRYVAYRTGPASPGVWVQRLGELTARRLPTEPTGKRFWSVDGYHLGLAAQPFWAPDGRSVGLAGPDGIQSIAVENDSAPRPICTCPVTGGAAWGPDGTILFAHDSGISRVPAGGGPITPVTALADERGEFAHQFPVFLPGGRRFLYLVRSMQPQHRGVYLASIDRPAAARRIHDADSNVGLGLGPDGRPHLLFVRDITLTAQPFNIESGALIGSPVVIAPRVVPGQGGRFAPFSAAGRSVVFRQTAPARNRLRWFDRRGIPQAGTFDRVGSFRYVALSRDGRALAAAEANRDTTKLDIWIHDLERNVSERMTTDPIGAYFPVWMPRGDRLIFASAREGPWHLFWQARDRPEAGRLLAGPLPGSKYPTDVTADGRYVIFNADEHVAALELSGSAAPRMLVAGLQGRVSPDGRWLAYTSSNSGRREVYVTAFPEARERWRISEHGGEDPHWRSDGRELFFLDANGALVAAELSLTASVAVKRLIPLFRAAIDVRSLRVGPSYAPAPDGQRFLLIERMDDEEVVLTVRENWQSGREGP